MDCNNRIFLLIFSLFLIIVEGQNQKNNSQDQTFEKIAGLFDSYSENDERALVFVDMYINKAKHEQDFKKLIRGYEEAIYYNSTVKQKLLYADSTVIAAKRDDVPEEISRAYLGKGIIYYYNLRQYKQALEQYLIAFRFSKDSDDHYLKNKIIYHLGMVKSYLGYYKEASLHFEESAKYFERNMSKRIHRNLVLNNESGYFNSLYRLSVCYRNLQLFKKEDSLITIGLERLNNTESHSIEYGYFQNAKGVQLLRERKVVEAIEHLKLSEYILSRNQDYASLSTVYFYMGKAYRFEGNKKKSLLYLNKMDSLLTQYRSVTPEIRSGYEYLINNAKQDKNSEKQLYYTNQLLKADSIISTDFAMLSSRIYREYETDTLQDEKAKLEIKHKKGSRLIYILTGIGFVLLLLSLSLWWFLRRQKKITISYKKLLKEFNDPDRNNVLNKDESVSSFSSERSSEIIEEVTTRLKVFEQDKLFLNKNLTLPLVAKMIGCKSKHLSFVLNDHFNISFKSYLKILRIKYITNLMLGDSKYLKYSMQGLAAECGMTNRQNFSSHFMEINGIRPIDFIKKRRAELKNI